jgi:hypothetical protein
MKLWLRTLPFFIFLLLIACGGQEQQTEEPSTVQQINAENVVCPPDPEIVVPQGTVVGTWKANVVETAWYNPTIEEYGIEFEVKPGREYKVIADYEGEWYWGYLLGTPDIRITDGFGNVGWVRQNAGLWQCPAGTLANQ